LLRRRLLETIKAWAADDKIIWQQRPFERSDLDRIFLAVVATPLKTLNKMVSEEAQRRRILCNVVRDRPLCNFYFPAVVRRGPLQIAISTAGHSGGLAQRLRKQMEAQFGPEWERWLRWLGEARTSLYEDPISPKRRRTMLHRLASQKKQAEFFDRWGIPTGVASKKPENSPLKRQARPSQITMSYLYRCQAAALSDCGRELPVAKGSFWRKQRVID
jgi:siroheme synthase-like protein